MEIPQHIRIKYPEMTPEEYVNTAMIAFDILSAQKSKLDHLAETLQHKFRQIERCGAFPSLSKKELAEYGISDRYSAEAMLAMTIHCFLDQYGEIKTPKTVFLLSEPSGQGYSGKGIIGIFTSKEKAHKALDPRSYQNVKAFELNKVKQ